MTVRQLPKILVVDDEDEHLAIRRKILEEVSYGVETCSSGHEALSKLRGNHYDAILCDMWMPGITGIGFYQLVKEEFPQYERRFIFITTDIASEMIWEFIRTRNLPYVIKPFSPIELLEKLSEVLGDRLEAASEVRQDETNKRQNRRLIIKADVRVRQKKWEASGPDTASLVGISRRGVRFYTNRQYWIGAEVLVTYPVTDPNALEQQGKVIRIEELRDGWRRVAVALNIERTVWWRRNVQNVNEGPNNGGDPLRIMEGWRDADLRTAVPVLERRMIRSVAPR
ncbi:MAG: response regulator [Acidobacteria bacterium]|nr:response regulator [Acidobacteriota bacterium]